MLRENYKNDILDTSENVNRKYNMVTNPDDTVSLEDVTVYSQEGDAFGASDINATNHVVNILDSAVDNIDIRVDSVSGKPQWKGRGADTWQNFSSSGVPKYLWAYNGNYLQYANYLYTQSQNLNITEDGVLFFAVSNSYAFSNEKQSAHVVYATINGVNQPLGCVCDSNQSSMNPMTYYMNVKAGDVVSVTDYMISANGHGGNICYTIHAMLVPMGELEIIDNGTFTQSGGGFTASGIDESVCSFANHKLTMKKKGTIAFVFNVPNSFYYETYKNDVQYARIGVPNVVCRYRTAIPVDVGDTVYITTAPSGYIYFYE